jgi:hypothetical protein
MKDAIAIEGRRERARDVSSGPMPNGRGGIRSLTRPMRASSTAGRRRANAHGVRPSPAWSFDVQVFEI